MNVPEEHLEDGTAKEEYENSLPQIEGKTNRLTTHVWLHRELRRSLLSRTIDRDEVDKIMDSITVICGVRVRADYKREIVLEPRARGIHQKAADLIKTLDKLY